MPVPIPRSLVEYILLGPTGDRRQLQDSPVLGDVWIEFATNPGEPQELLITPHRAHSAGKVAAELDDLIEQDRKGNNNTDRPAAEFAYLQGIVAARLYFDEVLRVIVPETEWWRSPRKAKEMQIYADTTRDLDGTAKAWKALLTVLGTLQEMVTAWSRPARNIAVKGLPTALDRYAALAGLLLWASQAKVEVKKSDRKKKTAPMSDEEAIAETIKNALEEEGAGKVADRSKGIGTGLNDLFQEIMQREQARAEQQKKSAEQGAAGAAPLVYQISLNRQASLAVLRSVPAVKADAARTLFKVQSKDIAWAVLDSGIQGDHPAFLGEDGNSRVKASFDFSNFRKIVSLENLRILKSKEKKDEMLGKLLHDRLKNKPTHEKAIEYLTSLAEDAKHQRPIHWEWVKPFIEIKIDTPPNVSDHGTHVAGIIGANANGPKLAGLPEDEWGDYVDGMCPDIQLYDFRILAGDITDTEFAIIAALQYIRSMNARHDHITIHGANLSLSIPHDVRNYACGRTPICQECERLVNSGVVVVAAAGNFGYQSFQTKEGGSYEGYTAFSVTDPGNADEVITVGATHRYSPHTYGVSFFSSRGPTGDGRPKPDLVAPGERIRAPFRQRIWGDLDGTSMAAPHVSGAAAMLMARYSELIGQPRKVKRILCDSATDLGRERSFQGSGMLDVLRAFQSI
jgi:serine protease AprX